MSDRPIQIGDLVAVTKWHPCCCCLGHMGTVIGFGVIENNGCAECDTHGPEVNYKAARVSNSHGVLRVRPEWLKRIPPLEELEGQRTQEDIKEPA